MTTGHQRVHAIVKKKGGFYRVLFQVCALLCCLLSLLHPLHRKVVYKGALIFLLQPLLWQFSIAYSASVLIIGKCCLEPSKY